MFVLIKYANLAIILRISIKLAIFNAIYTFKHHRDVCIKKVPSLLTEERDYIDD